MKRIGIGVVTVALGFASAASASPVTVPFDFSRGEVAFTAEIRGVAVYALLDTGVDPSVIDAGRAQSLHLKINRSAGGEASGEGDAKSSISYPTTIEGLSIGTRRYGPIDAITSELSGLAAAYGRPIDAFLGYSFLKDQPVLIDYTKNTLTFLDRDTDANGAVRSCKTRFQIPLILLKDLNWPVLPAFRLGDATAPVSLDTGSNSGVALYRSALDLPGVKAALQETGTVGHGGFRGSGTVKADTFNAPIGFGPFNLPPGQAVTVRDDVGSTDTRVANVGNRVLADMKLKMLLDYPARRITFWGDCA
jgi:hypothetical protein